MSSFTITFITGVLCFKAPFNNAAPSNGMPSRSSTSPLSDNGAPSISSSPIFERYSALLLSLSSLSLSLSSYKP